MKPVLFKCMQRTIRRQLIDEWLAEAYPDAITKLARRSGVPASSIAKIRNGRVPKNSKQRERLAKAIGVDESDLFPVLADGEEKSA